MIDGNQHAKLLMAINDVCETTGFSRSFVFQETKAGNFPKQIKLGRSSRWITAEVYEWVADKAQARGQVKGC